MEFEENKMKIMLDETTQTDEIVNEESKQEITENQKKKKKEEDERRIYNYSEDCWDEKYLSPHLLTTGYEAKLITNKLSFGIYSFITLQMPFAMNW